MENPETSITQDERTMATLAHALQVAGWWIAPLVIFLLQRKSRFVSFHALQALLLQIAYLILMGGFIVLWMVGIFATIAHQSTDKSAPPPVGFFILMPLTWLGFFGMWALVLVFAILYAIKAGRGEWANYPLVGKVARRILKMDQAEGTTAPSATC